MSYEDLRKSRTREYISDKPVDLDELEKITSDKQIVTAELKVGDQVAVYCEDVAYSYRDNRDYLLNVVEVIDGKTRVVGFSIDSEDRLLRFNSFQGALLTPTLKLGRTYSMYRTKYGRGQHYFSPIKKLYYGRQAIPEIFSLAQNQADFRDYYIGSSYIPLQSRDPGEKIETKDYGDYL